jgi:hypothetical protein
MIEMGVGEEDMVDACQFTDGQFGDAGAGIDQDVVVNQERRGAQMPATDATDAAAATENA